jgi:hypothetical protein
MALKNKDGSVYRLRGPNPVMKSQELWTGFVTHNMKWEGEKAEDTNRISPIISDFEVRDTFLSALDKARDEIKVVEKPPERKPIVQADTKKVEEEKNTIEKIFIHCLPANIKERKDFLYGETYKTIQYGKPTSFEGVILDQQDLSMEIWTDYAEVSIESVLYPKTGYRRWWKVQDKTQKGGGWVLMLSPSSYQPSFDL